MAKTTITFFLRVKDGKKVKETEYKDLQTLYEAKREAEKAGTFLATGAHVTYVG
jgi:hypothetical protein